MKNCKFKIKNGAMAAFFFAFCIFNFSLSSQSILTAPGLASFIPPVESGGGGTCPADGSPNVTQTGSTLAVKINSDEPYAGQLYTTPSAITLCKVSVDLTAAVNLTGINFNVKVFAVSGGSFDQASPLGTSDTVAGNTSWSHSNVIFPFSTPVSLSGSTSYAIVVTSSAGTSAAAWTSKNASGTLSGDYIWAHANGTIVDPGDGSDWVCSLYWY